MYATTSSYVQLNISTQNQPQHYSVSNSNSSTSVIEMRNQSCGGNISPAQFSIRSGASFAYDMNGTNSSIDTNSVIRQVFEEPSLPTTLNLQIFVPELQLQKCLTVNLDDIIWDIKLKLFDALPHKFQQYFNYGFFLPPCDGRAGKFLLEDRPIRDYPFHDCVPYVELKYKKRVYKTIMLDEKAVKNLHSKSNLKKFMEYVLNRNAEKVEKMCQQGIDPNFFDSNGETPLTRAAIVPNNSAVIVQLAGGGAHLDYRNSDGQTALHKSAFSSIFENVKALLELGASPNYRDSLGLTPLYYNMLKPETNSQIAELLLTEAADIFVVDHYANNPLHQACKNGLIKQVELLLFYGANINAQNVNGNTPLHVCAVNNRVKCAQTLLYRGADYSILNKNGQTAIHVAHIVNNTAVADVIQRHNPESNDVIKLLSPQINDFIEKFL